MKCFIAAVTILVALATGTPAPAQSSEEQFAATRHAIQNAEVRALGTLVRLSEGEQEHGSEGRDTVAAVMTPEQIAEAQRLARAWCRRAPACAALHPRPASGRIFPLHSQR